MQAYHDIPYINLVKDVLENGVTKHDRTGVGTITVFGRQMRFDLSDGTIPLLTTKKMHLPSIIHELLWYLQGTGNIKYLQEHGVRIWNEWADENGDLGPVYGTMWRHWPSYVPNALSPAMFNRTPDGIDQIAQLVDGIKNSPDSRRLMVSAWNVELVPQMALPPCHFEFQIFTEEVDLMTRIENAPDSVFSADLGVPDPVVMERILDGANVPSRRLSMMLNMRSNDVGLGNPFNIAQYAILLRMLCEVTNTLPGELVYTGGDVHIYTNHVDAREEQITRQPFPSPTLKFNRNITDIDDFKFEDFVIENYEHHPAIKMVVAV